MAESENSKFFMGYKLTEEGVVEGAIPEVQHFMTEMTDRIIQSAEGFVYKQCLKLNIDPDVLEKQLVEIKRLNYVIQQKEEQIEKLKCCGSCRNRGLKKDGISEPCYKCKRWAKGEKEDKWEPAE